MEWSEVWPPLLGGGLIGVAAAALLLLTGKTAGISGIVDGVVRNERGEVAWKAAFVVGLVAGGVLLAVTRPEVLPDRAPRGLPLAIVAGLLVGFGTRLGGGCTSGHGVCGIGRMSGRGLIGTCIFIAVAAATVFVMRVWGV